MSDLVPTTLNLPRALVAQLDAAAEREARTRSALVRVLLADVLAGPAVPLGRGSAPREAA